MGVLKRLGRLLRVLATLPDDLDAIWHELEHDRAGSLRDGVARAEFQGVEPGAEVFEERAHVRELVSDFGQTIARVRGRMGEHNEQIGLRVGDGIEPVESSADGGVARCEHCVGDRDGGPEPVESASDGTGLVTELTERGVSS